MSGKLGNIKNHSFCNNFDVNKFTAFALIGFLNFWIDFSSFYSLAINNHINIYIANILAWFIAVNFSYFANGAVTWRYGIKNLLKITTWLKFLTIGLLSMLVATVALGLLSYIFSIVIAKLLSIIISLLINFIFTDKYAFYDQSQTSHIKKSFLYLLLNPIFFLVIFVIIWTFIACIYSYNLPLDVLENLSFGRLWVMGTYKHPPMMAWAQEIAAMIFIQTKGSAFFISFLWVAISAFFIYKTCLYIHIPKHMAQLAPLLMVSIYYYNIRAVEFNANVANLLFWCAYIFYFIKACHDNRWQNWLMVGLVGALGLYSKYSFAIVLFSSLPSVLLVRQYRYLLFSWGSYLAAIFCVIIFMPHILWMVQTDFLILHYAPYGKEDGFRIFVNIASVLKFMMLTIAVVIPIFLLLTYLAKGCISFSLTPLQLLTVSLILSSFVITLMAGIFSDNGLRVFWGYPIPASFVICVLLLCQSWRRRSRFLKRYYMFASLIILLPAFAYMAMIMINPYIRDKGKRVDLDGRTFAAEILNYWQRYSTSGGIPSYIMGEHDLADAAGWYIKERPRVIATQHIQNNPWVDVDTLPDEILWLGRYGKFYENIDHCLMDKERITYSWRDPPYSGGYDVVIAIIPKSCL